jgi:hypothetical protein
LKDDFELGGEVETGYHDASVCYSRKFRVIWISDGCGPYLLVEMPKFHIAKIYKRFYQFENAPHEEAIVTPENPTLKTHHIHKGKLPPNHRDFNPQKTPLPESRKKTTNIRVEEIEEIDPPAAKHPQDL